MVGSLSTIELCSLIYWNRREPEHDPQYCVISNGSHLQLPHCMDMHYLRSWPLRPHAILSSLPHRRTWDTRLPHACRPGGNGDPACPLTPQRFYTKLRSYLPCKEPPRPPPTYLCPAAKVRHRTLSPRIRFPWDPPRGLALGWGALLASTVSVWRLSGKGLGSRSCVWCWSLLLRKER